VENLVLATDADATPLASLSYDPWGLPSIQGDESPRYTFNGKERDPVTGLYDFEARHYDPAAGVFVSADTDIGGSGTEQDAFNRYAFVLNDPLSHGDPTGHNWLKHSWHKTKHAARHTAAHAASKTARAVKKGANKVVKGAEKTLTSDRAMLGYSFAVESLEIGVGAALIATSAGDPLLAGAGNTLFAGGLTGMEYSATHTGGNFSWGGWGAAEAEGLVAGAAFSLTMGVGAAGVAALGLEGTAMTGALVFAGAAAGAGGTFAGELAFAVARGHAALRDVSWEAIVAGGVGGAVGEGVGEGWLAESGNLTKAVAGSIAGGVAASAVHVIASAPSHQFQKNPGFGVMDGVLFGVETGAAVASGIQLKRGFSGSTAPAPTGEASLGGVEMTAVE
jgi:RHS repeat-associated protein